MKNIIMFIFLLMISLVSVNAVVPTMTSDVQTYYNSSIINITLTNDWMPIGDINDNLTLSDFDIVTNLTENSGNIELTKGGYNISSGIYGGINKIIGSQDTSPTGMTFNNDGSKVYMVGSSNGVLYEYDCTTNYKINTCTYSTRSLDISSEDITPYGMAFNNDGSKVFMIGRENDDIYEYTCTTNYKIDTCTYSTRSLSIGSQDGAPTGLTFNNDGSKVFMIGVLSDKIHEYTCTTNYKIDTCTYSTRSLSVTSQDGFPYGVVFNNDGSNVYMVGDNSNTMYEYACTTNYKMDTCSYSMNNLDTSSQDTSVTDLAFNNDGSKVYIMGNTQNSFFEYDLSGDFFSSGYLQKNYTTTKLINNFELSDIKVLNGKTIVSKLFYNGTEYSLSTILSLDIQSGQDFQLRYYFTGNETVTPTLSDIFFQAINTNEPILSEMFYNLNGIGDISLGNTTNITFQITGIEGLNNINFSLFSDQGNSTLNETFTIDIIPPNIDIIGNIIQFEKTINFSTIYNVTDNLSGLANCTINITYLEANESDSNFFIGCTDIQIFTRAGSYNWLVEAIDNAGNINTSSDTGTINQLINVFFNETNGDQIFNYTAKIFHPDGRITFPEILEDGNIQLSPVNNGELDLGIHNIEFSKDSFSKTNFTVNITVFSNNQNITFNVSLANMNISIFNRFDNSVITDLVNIQLIGPVGITSSTSTGVLNLNSTVLVSGSYELVATSENFFTESIFFTYTNQENLELNIFLLNNTETNIGQIEIFVKNNFEELQPNVLLKLLEYDNNTNAFTDVSQTTTNLNGVGFFNVELGTKKYIFRAISGDLISDSSINGEFIFIDDDSRTLILRAEGLRKLPNLKNFIFNVDENETARGINISNIIVTWDDSNNLVNKVCIQYFKKTGISTIFLTEFCDSSSSGTLESNVVLNLSENSIIAEVNAFVDNSIYPLDSFIYLRSNSTQDVFESLGFLDYILLAVFTLGIGVGIMMNIPALGAIGLILLSGFLVKVFPSWISGSLAALITLICFGIIYIGVRRE